MTAVIIIAVVSFGLALWALAKACQTNEFASQSQTRMNHHWKLLETLRDGFGSQPILPANFMARLTKIEHELFRTGTYPDLGLREWGRNWRGKLRAENAQLREDVRSLSARIQKLETPATAPVMVGVVAKPVVKKARATKRSHRSHFSPKYGR